ncbi:MAG: hypothetical protein Q8M40_11910 [Legionella sp.]|nr:hypothetical protein [Legionella sp.]
MKYAVTYCTLDGDAGGNPLWHSCLLLSQVDEKGKLEVIHAWGFYGLPATDRNKTFWNNTKNKIGLNVDFKGNHGMLRSEELRFLDLGCGLHGKTFELTQEQFERLQNACQKMVTDQNAAIADAVTALNIQKSTEPTKIYEYEHKSAVIYAWEKQQAAMAKREPRLKPFELVPAIDFRGPGLHKSQTCKTQSLALLSTVLTAEQIAGLTQNGKHPTLPRFSGALETIYLHSTGELSQHKKKSGETVYYRDWKTPGVKLYWTIPPQNIDALSQDTMNMCLRHKDYIDEIKILVSRLQRMEHVWRNAQLAVKQTLRDNLINQIITFYQSFSVLNANAHQSKLNGFCGYMLYLCSLPRNQEERNLFILLKDITELFNQIYMAIIDSPIIKESNAEYYLPEYLCQSLDFKDRLKICRILNRNYCTPPPISIDEWDEFVDQLPPDAGVALM